MGCGILSFYRAASRSAKDITGLHDKTHMVLIYLWLIGGPVADVLIAIAMTTLVRRSLICLSHPNFQL
jgi:hypothetical protein